MYNGGKMKNKNLDSKLILNKNSSLVDDDCFNGNCSSSLNSFSQKNCIQTNSTSTKIETTGSKHSFLFKCVFSLFIVISLLFLTTACGNIYDDMKIVLSNNGEDVVLYLGGNAGEDVAEITATIEGDKSISRELEAFTENDKILVDTKMNSDNSTTIIITANANGVCKDAPVIVQSKEGNKKVTFYVSVEIPIESMIETTDSSELFVVKGVTKTLLPKNLLIISPENTTQNEVSFLPFGSLPDGVILTDNTLFVPETFNGSTIQIQAISNYNPSMQTVITLNVIEKITDNINYQAFYNGTSTEIDLQQKISIAKNVAEKNSIDFKISLNSQYNLNITPYMLSSLSQISKFASITSYSKTFVDGVVSYAFTISAETENGEDAFYFDISYVDYNYSIQTQLFNFETYDAVKQLSIEVDGEIIQENILNLDVYDNYYGRPGMEILANIFPTTVPEMEKGIVLKLGTNAINYIFMKQNPNGSVENIIFENNQYTFQSGERFYIKAKSVASGEAVFTLESLSNPEIYKQFNLSSRQGASNLTFDNAVQVGDSFYYYLTTNGENLSDNRVQVNFSVNNTFIDDISFVKTGQSFNVVGDVYQGTESNSYYLLLESLTNAPDETGILTIQLGNGLTGSVFIECFAKLDKSSISFNVPSAQYDASIGYKSILDDIVIDGVSYNLEFFVAIHNGKATTLTVDANSSFTVSYSFYDLPLGAGSAYDESYVNFNNFSKENGVTDINNFASSSTILRSLYLNSFGTLNAIAVGKTWVCATVEGFDLVDNQKQVVSYQFYFLVESYNPVTTFELSKSAVTLYALNSVGDANINDTFTNLSITINQDATYNKISWSNFYATLNPETNVMSYILNGEEIFRFTVLDNGQLLLEAFSTLYADNDSVPGATVYNYAKSLSFDFIAQYTEFGIKYPINLHATIKKAVQVENIVVENLNIENGIYIELGYSNNDIVYPILAHADNGINNEQPLNPNLVYTFLPDGETPSSILSLNSNTGIITISKDQQLGGTGVIRIAPADRFVNGVYVAGEKDIAVYVKITIADGRNRDTSYRISSIDEIKNPNLHYTLLANVSVDFNSPNNFAIFDVFDGGLYGALENSNSVVSTIITNKTLFGTLTKNAIIEDLIVVGDIVDSLGGFIANINNGIITNVTVETQSIGNAYKTSSLNLSSNVATVNEIYYVGGIVGVNTGSINNCYFFGSISANSVVVGGIAGLNSGNIQKSGVEFYNFPDNYSQFFGGDYVGGVVGEMTGGSLFECYAYSYVSSGDADKNYINLNILNSKFGGSPGADGVGGIIGKLTSGNVDKCFAEINDVNKMFAEVNSQNASIKNAYIIFRTSNTDFDALYYYNGEILDNLNSITTDSIWHAQETGVNHGYPYFINMLPVQATPLVANSLANTENIISVEGQSIIFFFDTNQTLSKQEQTALLALNTISFETLLGIDFANGIRAISSNSSIISAYSNGIVIKGLGTCSLTLFSKYDYSLSKTFTIYVVSPITDFVLSYNETDFSNGSTITSKINQNLTIYGKVSVSKLLVNRSVEFVTDGLQLTFDSYQNYIQGSGLGGYVIDTQKIFADTGLYEIIIDYNLQINELSKSYISSHLDDDLTAINDILLSHFNGSFTLKMFKGADKIEISPKSEIIEPSDTLNFEVNIFGDVDFNESPLGEALALNIISKTTGSSLSIISQNVIDNGETTLYQIGQNGEIMFEVVVKHAVTVYYLSSTDLSKQTLNPDEATYYQHKFNVTLEVADTYKNHSFNNSQFDINVIATTSQSNNNDYNEEIVSENFELTIKSQSVLSLGATHYSLNSKVLRVVDEQNVTFYYYSSQANSVLTTGEEGMLEIDIFPTYASYSSLEVTYSTLNNDDFNIRLSLLDKQNDGSFIKSSKGFVSLENGVKIFNNYDNNFVSSLNSLYLSTFIPESIDKDTIFVLKIEAFDENGNQVGVVTTFNLVVQYLKGASISIVDENGEEARTLVRGGTQTILITVDKEQTLGSLTIRGYQQTQDANNFVSYSKFTEIIDNAKNTKTYKATLYIGTGLVLENNSNYLTFEAGVDWIVNGKIQTKTTSINIGVVDFDINDITLKTDKIDKSTYNAYIGVQSALNFEFNIREFLTASQGNNPALQAFLTNYYYKAESGLGVYGDYVVNYGFESVGSLMGNLYYVNGNTTQQVLRDNGTFNPNDYFNFETDGSIIKVTGKRVGAVQMLLSLPVKYPDFSQNVVRNINFYFTINVEVYSDEDTPRIIDDEEAFLDALNASEPQNYILMNDLYLRDYTPQNTTGISSLDGNNYTINILSYNTSVSDSYLKLALFNTISSYSTIKNIIVNTYHASAIAVDTTLVNKIDVAGFALKNDGIVYNCQVLAFESDDSRPNLNVPQGLNVTYSMGQIDDSVTSRIAGFVIENVGSITNSRVGGKTVEYAISGSKQLDAFNIVGQGNISGFVYENSGSIASSFAGNITITNNTLSGTQTFTSGFAGNNSGNIQLSYVEGVGDSTSYSLATAGISTASISAGFVYNNNERGVIGDCYANILLATTNLATQQQYASGRLTSGFVYSNEGEIARCYTASKIENAKTTQMNFIGVDSYGEMQNKGAGSIKNSYYYNLYSDLDDAYAGTSDSINVSRITEPDLATNFYGFSFAETSSSLNGVWYITSTGPKLVSANQIAVSSRYISDAKRDAQTGELISYKLPYYDGYDYGSVRNPIIIRDAKEFNLVFGGGSLNAGTAISAYYDLTSARVFGNYRIVTNINLADLITDTTSGVKIYSSNMSLYGGKIDGNMFTVQGLELVANLENVNTKDYGMFAKLENNAIIMNLNIEVVAVNAVTMQNVGTVAGTVENSKLINLTLYSGDDEGSAEIVGNNIVGGVVGKVVGESEIKNVSTTNINIIANNVAPGESQRFNRDETLNNRVNANTSYAGGIAGVADIYKSNDKADLSHNNRLTNASLAFLTVNGNMQISGSTVGGILGYLGPQTLIKDVTFELSADKEQKLIAYNFSAGGIVGECYGDIDMARATHELALQTLIENSVASYYSNPATSNIERGNINLFEHEEEGKYQPQNIGGLVGELITGNISHSYSKLMVRNSLAVNGGGVVGKISYASNDVINNINIYEVYTFSDVYASSAVGGFAGYIDQTRTLSFDKVNMVNYWSLVYNNQTSSYYLPDYYYDIFAKTGTRNVEAKLLKEIVYDSGTSIEIKDGYSRYSLPVIAQEIHSDDVYAMSYVDFNNNGTSNTIQLNSSYASIGSNIYFKIIDADVQSIKPLKSYVNAEISGSEMDAYFRNSDWDPNFWRRYSTDMLPRLVSNADVNIFYIYVAQDLQNMVSYPDATFIVVGQDGNGIVPVGNYIRSTGLFIDNFSGVLRGYDNSGNYGFDFEGYSLTFINATTTGAKIYNLKIENLGSSASQYLEGEGSFVGNAVGTNFENLTFKNCALYALATYDFYNIGLLSGHINGGFISNISFEDCSVDVLVDINLNELNVGMMAGSITTPTNTYMQVADITAYMNGTNINSGLSNRLNVNVNGYTVTNLNMGTIAGDTDGSVLLYYTSKSSVDGQVKHIGVSDTASVVFTPDTDAGIQKGLIIEVRGSGTVENYNAGLGFGRANVLNLSYQRSASELKFVGAIKNSGTAIIEKAFLGGYIGRSLTSSLITNGSGSIGNYMYVDCDIDLIANENVSAGMLIGESSQISTLENVDTYGTINVVSQNASSFIGGIVGKANSDTSIGYCISRTSISFNDSKSNLSSIGGLIGYVSSPNCKILIGKDNFKTQYLGNITLSATNVIAGGIVGSFASQSSSDLSELAGVEINSAVFGGNITLNSTEQAQIGGIVGSSNYSTSSVEADKVIDTCFAYGNIIVNADFSKNDQVTNIGGIIGKGSSQTQINQNFAVSTIYTKYTQTQTKLNVNAVVGQANGAYAGTNSISGTDLINYYSHQLSLCLDNSGVKSENIYYYTKNNGSNTMLNVLQIYINSLSEKDRLSLAYEGSKLNPFIINNETYAENSYYFNHEIPNVKNNPVRFFVVAEDMNENVFANIELKNSFVVGDGFSITNTSNSVFDLVDSTSTVAGLAIKSQITTPNSTYFAKDGNAYNGVGTIADINDGYIYSCNVNEINNAKTHGVYGLNSSASGGTVYAGGFVGVNLGYIADCYASLDLYSNANAGGFAGLNVGTISHSYANGTIQAQNADSFAKSIRGGGIYYSYTVSKINGSGTVFDVADALSGVYSCFYDIYATGVLSNSATQMITDDMAVFDSQNILANPDLNTIDDESGKLIPNNFLVNEEKLDDTAKIKFSYDYRYNNGYPTFNGPAYKSLTYMQDCYTGDGYSQENAVEISNIGKLQQIDDWQSTSGTFFALTNNISLTNDMKNANNKDENIDVWRSIGQKEGNSSPGGSFKGTFTGEYSTTTSGATSYNYYSIINLNFNGAENYAGLFGETENAKIYGLNIEFEDLNDESEVPVFNISYAGALAGKISNTTINNVTIENPSFKAEALNSSSFGGLVGEANGSTIEDCELSNVSLNASSGGNQINVGGIVGYLSGNNSSITNTKILNSAIINSNSSGSSLGGIVGNVTGSSNSSTKIENCEIPTNTKLSVKSTISNSNPCYVGALSGNANNANFVDINLSSGYEFNIQVSNSTVYNGALVGYSNDSMYTNVTIGNNYKIDVATTGGAFVGAMFGQVIAENVELQLSQISIPNNNTIKVSGGSSSNNVYLGGLVGQSSGVDFSGVNFANLSSNTLTYNSNATGYVGGLAGSITGRTSLSGLNLNFGTGQLEVATSGKFIFGGIAGQVNDNVTISNASVNYSQNTFYNIGNISSALIGGLVGELNDSNINGRCSSSGLDFSNLRFGNLDAGGIVASTSENSNISGANVNSLSFDGASISSSANIGGIASKVGGNTELTSCSVQNLSFNALTVNGESYISGIVSQIDDSARVENCNVYELYFQNMNLSNNSFISGLVAQAQGTSRIVNCELNGFTIANLTTNNSNFAGAVAKISGTPTLDGIDANNIRIEVQNVNSPNIGGIVANANARGVTISNSNVNMFNIVVSQGTGNAYFGGLAGQASDIDFNKCGVDDFEITINGFENNTVNIGGIAGLTNNVNIVNGTTVKNFSYINNQKTNIYLGGLVGYATSTTIGSSQGQQSVLEGIELINANNSEYSFATIDNSSQVGGIVGRGNNVNISNFKLDNIVVINGSIDGQDDINTTTGAGGVAGNLEGLENNISNITISNSFISALTKAGGVTGTFAGGNISNITTENSVNIYSGTSGSARVNQNNYQISLNSDNIPLAGGIVAQMKAGTISQSTNNANVVSGYNEQHIIDDTGYTSYQLPDYYSSQGMPMVAWNAGYSMLIKPTEKASKESYAGGIAGRSSPGVEINGCTNNGSVRANAVQELYTKCLFEMQPVFWGLTICGTHKFYYSFLKELAYANGITYLEPQISYDSIINDCHNRGQIRGGAELGINWVYNTPYLVDPSGWLDPNNSSKFFALNYGLRNGVLFNSYTYLYARNGDVRDQLYNRLLSYGGLMGVATDNEGANGKIVNVYYANQICNNPAITYRTLDGYKIINSITNLYTVTNCTISNINLAGQGYDILDLVNEGNSTPTTSFWDFFGIIIDGLLPTKYPYVPLQDYNHQNDEGMGISYA